MIFYTVFLLLFLGFAFLMLFIITSAFIGFLRTRVPFVPTHAGDIRFIVEKLGITSGAVFYDLGSGDGKVCFLVNDLTGAQCVGFELTWWTYVLAILKSKLKRQKSKLEFKHENFFNVSWAEADYIYGYLYPPLMGRVEEKFLADGKPGAIAIIRDFPFPKLKPVNIYNMPKEHEIYVYRK